MAATDEGVEEQHAGAAGPPVTEAASAAGAPLATSAAKAAADPASADKMADHDLLPATSLPVTMLIRPASHTFEKPATGRFIGELPEDFESALARVEPLKRRPHLLGAWIGRGRHRRDRASANGTTRVVAFDGFRSRLFDEKIERDRRYGTVYTVREERNAYLVRLEMPRRVPASALKEAWGISDDMPDYDYRLWLEAQVLSIRASVGPEAVRRLAYISSSFPADFFTRIEFAQPVEGFVHKLDAKVLEIIVFKREATPT